MLVKRQRLRPGDIVEVRAPVEILSTLDGEGALDALPFMPEMVDACGRRFRIASMVTKTCMSGSGPSTMRSVGADDVFTLEGLRCSGAAHDGCQKGCLVFWRGAWLRKIERTASEHGPTVEGRDALLARLKTKSSPQRYFCQASELPHYSAPITRLGRVTTSLRDIAASNASVIGMARRIAIWVFWKVRRRVAGEFAAGPHQTTPIGTLGLRDGEHVRVHSVEEIRQTTNKAAHNRGLYFTPDMAQLSGSTCRVLRHVDKIIVDGTGEMRTLKNTVFLDGSYCGCAHVAFGGCPRQEFAYWREIWLSRTDETKAPRRASA